MNDEHRSDEHLADALERIARGATAAHDARVGAGAGIDVLEIEPPTDDHPLIAAWRDPNHLAYDRLIVNPHSAFYCEEGMQEMRSKGAEACRRALLGLPQRNVVN